MEPRLIDWPVDRRFLPPSVFMDALKDSVVGQDDMKPKLAHAFSHYTAFMENEEVGKPVPLMFGPSGSGKTYAIELCCEISKLDLTVVGAGSISPPGYKGSTLRDTITQHFLNYGTDFGVFYVDEIDKWTKGYLALHERPDPERVAIGLSLQAEALRYVEHDLIDFVDEAKDYESIRGQTFDTGHSMWLFSGAFIGLDGLIRHRIGQEQVASDDIWENADVPDFNHYGMMEEFSNRITDWAWVKPLTALQLMTILEQQDVPKWNLLFQMMGCRLILDGSALAATANASVHAKRGARGAKTMLNKTMGDVFTQASVHSLSTVTVDGQVMLLGRLPLE